MTKFLTAAAVIIGLAATGVAFANEPVKAAPIKAEVKTDAQAAAEAKPAAGAVKHELKDGTWVEVDGDKVFVIGKDGAKTAAPDGEHALKDGTMLKVKGGVLVK